MISLFHTFLNTLLDVAPIIGIIVFFQLFVIRKPVPQVRRVLTGIIYVLLGMTFFMEGLEKAIFPLGELMASQLTAPEFLFEEDEIRVHTPAWQEYYWVYIFAFAIGFSTTIAEPSLIAVAMKARDVSAGSISVWGLRVAVALGVAFGIALGTYRIVTGIPLHYFIITGYIVVIVQTYFSPRMIVPLAYDSGGVTTSTVTVPLVAALGLGLSSTVPGRNPVMDGFGLIAFASLFPIISVLAYAQLSHFKSIRSKRNQDAPDNCGH